MVKYTVHCGEMLRPWGRVICCGASRRPRRPSGAELARALMGLEEPLRCRAALALRRLDEAVEQLRATCDTMASAPPKTPRWVRYDHRHGIAAHRRPPLPDRVVNYGGQDARPRRVTEAWFAPERRCRVCGCTDEAGCFMGCWWVEADLCSECVGVNHAARN